jgi:hypothetical protein
LRFSVPPKLNLYLPAGRRFPHQTDELLCSQNVLAVIGENDVARPEAGTVGGAAFFYVDDLHASLLAQLQPADTIRVNVNHLYAQVGNLLS